MSVARARIHLDDDIRRGVSSPVWVDKNQKTSKSIPKIVPRERSNSDPWKYTLSLDFTEICLNSPKHKQKEKLVDKPNNKIIDALTFAVKRGDTSQLIKFSQESTLKEEEENITEFNQINIESPKIGNYSLRNNRPKRKPTKRLEKSITPKIHKLPILDIPTSKVDDNKRLDLTASMPSPNKSLKRSKSCAGEDNVISAKKSEVDQEKKWTKAKLDSSHKVKRKKEKPITLDKTEKYDLLSPTTRRRNASQKISKTLHSSSRDSSPTKSQELPILSHSSQSHKKSHLHKPNKLLKATSQGSIINDPVAKALTDLNKSLSDVPELAESFEFRNSYNPKTSPLLSEAERKSLVFLPSDEINPIAGTAQALLLLTLDNVLNEKRLRALIFAHEQFITPRSLMQLLISYFYTSRKLPSSSDEQNYIQMRVVLFICRWFSLNLHPFRDSVLVKEMNDFVEDLSKSNIDLEQSWSKLIKKSWADVRGTYELELLKGHINESTPRPLLTEKLKKLSPNSDISGLSVLDFDTEELARQLTLVDQKLFSIVPMTELLKKNWNNKETSPTLQKLVNRFNIVSKWTTTEICTTPNPKSRIQTLAFFINLADKLKKMQSYHSLLAVITGISQLPVSRLSQTWKGLNSMQIKKFNELERFIKPTGNFKKLREAINNAEPPYILPLSIVLKDLTFIEDGNKDWHNSSKKILNYEKIELLGKVLNQMALSHQTTYNYATVDLINVYVWNLYYLEDDDLISFSKKVEPPNDL